MKIAKCEVIRERLTSRGGGVEVSLSGLGKLYKNEKMTAYQNYLGGGMLGRICNDCTIPGWEMDERLQKVAMALRKYVHKATNPDTEWEGMSFEKRQMMPVSAY